jgi:putative DNA primase/helicase
MYDALSNFRDAIHAAGLEPPDVIEPGTLHRFPGIGKRNGNTAGWCKLFDDGLGGCFGDWSSDFSENWRAKLDKPFSPVKREAFKRHVADSQAQAEAEHKAKRAEAASNAVAIWDAAVPATDDHPYLARKGIGTYGARLHNGALLIPMRDGGDLHSLQFIGPDGDKRFLAGGRVAGCYYSIGSAQGAAALCIVEGFATGATLQQATGHPVAVAFNAGNLKAVAQTMRERFPSLLLIVCADDDSNTEGNPGLTKANEAAQTVGGLLVVPDFGPERPLGATDFNDMAAARGLEAVNDAIKNAAAPDDGAGPVNSPASEPWPEPQPLTAKVDAEFHQGARAAGGIVGAGRAVTGYPSPCRCKKGGKTHGAGEPVPADHRRFRRTQIYL